MEEATAGRGAAAGLRKVRDEACPNWYDSVLDSVALAAREEVVVKGRCDGCEHLVAIDLKTGRVIARHTDGQPAFVGLTSDLREMLADANRRIAVHHNHPSSLPLSRADLAMLASWPGLAELWAHGHRGASFRARPLIRDPDLVAAVYQACAAIARERLAPMVRAGTLLPHLAAALDAHAVALGLADAGLVEYFAFGWPGSEASSEALVAALKRRMGKAVARPGPKRGRPGFLIDLPNPYGPIEPWLELRDELLQLPQDDPAVREALVEIERELETRTR